MNARLGGIALVILAILAASGRFVVAGFVVGSLIWLACLRSRPSARWVLVVAVLIRVPFLFCELHSNDLYRYVWEGRIQWEGINPYAQPPDDPSLAHLRASDHDQVNHPELPAIYPPGAQIFFAAAAGAGLDERGLRNLILLLDLAVVAALLAWLAATQRSPGLALIYAWSPLAVTSAALGHYDPLLLLFLVLLGWAWETGRARRAAALLGGAILVKAVAVLLVPWMLLRRPRAALLFGLPVVVLGYLPYLGPDPFYTLVRFGSEYAYSSSLFRLAEWGTGDAARIIVGSLLLLWTGWVAVSQPRYAAAGALTFAGLLLLSPTVHYWYLAWFLVLIPAAGLRRWVGPLLLWCVTVSFSWETYADAFRGGEFVEDFVRTWLIYSPPGLLAVYLAWTGKPRRVPLVAAAGSSGFPSFSVVIPCRGEYANLRTLVPAWLASGAGSVILADTPTGDGTSGLAGGRVTYLSVDRRGYGAAVLAGLQAIRDDEVAVICDADHARGPDQIGELLAPFVDPWVCLVAAARTDSLRLPPAQRLGNALTCWLIGLGWGRRYHDLGPFRAIRRRHWPPGSLVDQGFGINVEMNVRALEQRLGVVEVPLPAGRRTHGANQIGGTLQGSLRAGWGMLRRLFLLNERRARAGLPRPTVVILTKLPGFLPVKRRLVSALGEEGARDVYVEMLQRTTELARRVGDRPVLAFSPPDADPGAAVPAVEGCTWRPVQGDDGATCLENAIADSYEGAPMVVLGGDVPDLPSDRVQRAVDLLQEYDVVFVPSGDGGFSLIGLREPVTGLSRGFDYGDDDALGSLRAFLEAYGRRVALLEPWPDVDTPDDLADWRRRASPRSRICSTE